MDGHHLSFLSMKTGQVECAFWESGKELSDACWEWEEGETLVICWSWTCCFILSLHTWDTMRDSWTGPWVILGISVVIGYVPTLRLFGLFLGGWQPSLVFIVCLQWRAAEMNDIPSSVPDLKRMLSHIVSLHVHLSPRSCERLYGWKLEVRWLAQGHMRLVVEPGTATVSWFLLCLVLLELLCLIYMEESRKARIWFLDLILSGSVTLGKSFDLYFRFLKIW